jgi:hypothetical protein
MEVHTDGTLVPGPSHLEVEVAIPKLKNSGRTDSSRRQKITVCDP